jgi:Ca2+-binding EF-hand superfamily protein
MRVRWPLIGAALFALGVAASQAEPRQQPASLLDVERVIAQGLAPGQRVHRFIESIKTIFHQLDVDRDGVITEADRQSSRQSIAALQRPQIVAQLLRVDYDGDGVVTRGELERYVDTMRRMNAHSGPPEVAARRAQGLANWLEVQMRADRNGDGRIDWAEMIAYARQTTEINPLSTFDPAYQTMLAFANRDGKTTMDEFVTALEKRFAEVDTDEDGIISREEFDAYWSRVGRPAPQVAAIQPSPQELAAEQCKLPRAPKDARVIVFNGYSFDGLSSVAIGSQDEITNATRVVIEPGREPLYLLLVGWNRVIWQFEGAVDRVKHAVLATVTAYDGKPTPAGATGLPQNIVTIAHQDPCTQFWVNMTTKHADDTRNSMRLLTGRPPDSIIDRGDVWNLHLPSGQVLKPTNDERRRGIPWSGRAGPDASKFTTKMLTYNRGGVVRIDADRVVSGQPATPYEVLPGHAGLVQLMLAGAIDVGQGDDILIRRQIRIPPGLAGALTERFVLLKGVPAPTGSPGHSTVVSEENGAVLCRGNSCQRGQ